MRIIPLQDFIDFVNSQPDEKAIKMGDAVNTNNAVGCLMVQFGRSVVLLA